MKKLVIKTASITFAALLLLGILCYALVACVFPLTLANIYDNAGCYGKSIKYYEKQYEKTKSTDDLAELCVKLYDNDDYDRAKDYLAELIADANFDEYCTNAEKIASDMTVGEFYRGIYVISVFYSEGAAASVGRAVEIIDERGFSDYDVFYLLIVECKNDLSENDKIAVKTAVESAAEKLADDSKEKLYAERDLNLLRES